MMAAKKKREAVTEKASVFTAGGFPVTWDVFVGGRYVGSLGHYGNAERAWSECRKAGDLDAWKGEG